jgi:hypothetical protein
MPRRSRNIFSRFRLAGLPAQASGGTTPTPDGGHVLYELGGETGHAVTEDGARITYDPAPEEAP